MTGPVFLPPCASEDLEQQPGHPSKIKRVRANHSFAPPGQVAAALQRLVPSVDGGIRALVLPMGAGRVVAADVAARRGYFGGLECFNEEAAVGDLLADPGLYFLEWLHYWSEWGSRGHLKEPVLATTLKALQAIGRAQRWRDTDFRVTVSFTNGTTGWPRRVSSPARRRVLLQVQRSGDCGSPRVAGSTRASRAATKPGSVSVNGLRPAPG
jgi:hypothetical protein